MPAGDGVVGGCGDALAANLAHQFHAVPRLLEAFLPPRRVVHDPLEEVDRAFDGHATVTDPLAYRPGRFAPDVAASRPSHAYVPFGGGPRICIGQHLALVEAVLVLATVVQRVRLHLVPGHPVDPEALVTMRPRHGMLMTAAAQ